MAYGNVKVDSITTTTKVVAIDNLAVTGQIDDADIAAGASIVDTKLSTISTADKVSVSAINIDGATDIGAPLSDTDLFIVDDGGIGNNKKTAASRITDYAFGKVSGDFTISSSGAAVISAGAVVTNDLADDAVTYAKIQNVSDTDKLLGRSSAGAGDIQEIPCTAAGRALLDDADVTAQRTTLGLGSLATQSAVGNISDTGAIGTTANVPIITGTSGVLQAGSFGTAANTFCQGNDARLSDTRTPTDGTVTDAKVATNAAIAHSKLANITAGNVLLGNASNVPTSTALSGDLTVNDTGVTTLANSGVTAGTYTKLTVDAKGRATVGASLEVADVPTLTSAKISDFDTQVRTSRLDQMAAPTAAVSLNSQKITSLATPTADTDAATKAYVDAVKQSLDIKDSVRVATTANITLSGTQTIDGVAVVAGDRVLVKNQTTTSANGIYVVAAGAWTRATDADANADVTAGLFVFVTEGTTNADSGWVLTTNDAITVGTTALSFSQFSGAGQITAGNGLTKTGNTLDVVGTAGRIVANADSIDLASSVISTPGTYTKTTVDTYGRVTAGASLASTDIPALGNIANTGAIGTTANLPIITGTSGVLQAGSFGTAANTFCQGNDARLSDTRNTTNAVTFNNGGTGAASGTTFNGSAAVTISYNTVGAPSTTGTGASGTSWAIGITGNAATATTATNLAGGGAGTIPYNTGVGATSQLAAGISGQFLKSGGLLAPSWVTPTLEDLPDAAFKRSVRCATTANITLSATQTIDGIAVVAGDRVLVKNQTTTSANGIYVVAAGAWTRALDADSASEIGGAVVNVDSGGQGGQLWTTGFKTTDTIGTTAMPWYKIITTGVVASAATTGTITIDANLAETFNAFGLNGSVTFAVPSGTPIDGQKLLIRIRDNGTARALTWTATAGGFRAIGITLPTTTIISKLTYIGCVYNATDGFWDAIASTTQA